jgi:hypothetical protein
MTKKAKSVLIPCGTHQASPGVFVCPDAIKNVLQASLLEPPPMDGSGVGLALCPDCIDRPPSGLGRLMCWLCFKQLSYDHCSRESGLRERTDAFNEIAAEIVRDLPYLGPLRDKLLSVGGAAVELLTLNDDGSLLPPDPHTVAHLVADGRVLSTRGIRDAPGQPMDCHQNVVALAASGKHAIGTGYALGDGLWCSHSWCVNHENQIIETTGRRRLYFGVVVSLQEFTEMQEKAESFYRSSVGG